MHASPSETLPDGAYELQVQAMAGSRISALSDAIQVTPNQNLVAIAGNSKVTLMWQPRDDVSYYNAYYGTNADLNNFNGTSVAVLQADDGQTNMAVIEPLINEWNILSFTE